MRALNFLRPVFFVLLGLASSASSLAIQEELEQGDAAKGPPNIVLAIADDWGWPHASAYGEHGVATPAFDLVAESGVLFEQAFVSSPSCTPSRGSLLTGQHFFRLGAGANLWCHWPEGRFDEYPALLAEAGYHVGSWRKAWGPGTGQPGGPKYKDIEGFFAKREGQQPFCLWFGAFDPHRPYKADMGAQAGIDPDRAHLFPHLPDVPEVRADVANYFGEVQRFDSELGALIQRLKDMGEWDNTLLVVTGDHGMPFPRCKGNVYDSGTRVPLAISWPARLPAGQRTGALVSLTDLAPSFLSAAGLAVPAAMTGRDLLPLMDGREPAADQRLALLYGRERHTPCQEAPQREGYPVRALRTQDFLFVHNLFPDRWPAGTPNHAEASTPNSWLGDCDNGPTKLYLWEHRQDPAVQAQYALCFAKRPEFELYDLRSDPNQLTNLAQHEDYAEARQRLSDQLAAALATASDPRSEGRGEVLEGHPYLGGGGGQWPFGKK